MVHSVIAYVSIVQEVAMLSSFLKIKDLICCGEEKLGFEKLDMISLSTNAGADESLWSNKQMEAVVCKMAQGLITQMQPEKRRL